LNVGLGAAIFVFYKKGEQDMPMGRKRASTGGGWGRPKAGKDNAN